jgi:hypothetical protein
MPPRATTTEASTSKKDDSLTLKQRESINKLIQDSADQLGLLETLSDRIAILEADIQKLTPQESLVPSEVWSSLGEKGVLQAALEAGISSALRDVPLATINKVDMRVAYADIALDMTETILVQAAKRMNRTVKPDESKEE